MINKFSNILVEKNVSVKDAMKQLDNSPEKILFVIEEEAKLIGSLTDGDIRRWILKEGSLNEKVMGVCFKGTFAIPMTYDIDYVKEEMQRRQISYVPVLNDQGNIIDFLVWEKIFDGKLKKRKKEKIENPVLIMAGGKGTRLDPFTRILPKPLIPIGDKSILEIIIDKFIEYGVEHFYISVNHKAKIIKSYFEEVQPEFSITFLQEDKPLGTIGVLKQLEGKLTKPIILTNCDIIIEADYLELIKYHNEQCNDITIVASIKHYNIPYGICEIENGGNLVGIREKPEYDFLVNTGMYIINPDMLKYIPANEFFHATHLIEKLQIAEKKVAIYPISENSWIDTGEWVEYKKAVKRLEI